MKIKHLTNDEISEKIKELKNENLNLEPNPYDEKCPDYQKYYTNQSDIRQLKRCLKDRKKALKEER